MPLRKLIETQNPDGGWPYVRGKSCTEPTVYAVLALLAEGENGAAGRALSWLQSLERPDGGWPPQAGVEESTWVTALVALVPAERLGAAAHARAIEWLLGVTGVESTRVYRLRQWLLGNRIPREQDYAGWPWLPGTAAWVAPTAAAILALDKQAGRAGSSALRARIEAGRQFLLSRACPDGGWNHGGLHTPSERPEAYPEVTGLALAALRGERGATVERGISTALRFLKTCRSGNALNWLRLGLSAQGRLPAGYSPPPEVGYRTLPEICLGRLISADGSGRCIFWG